MALIAFLWILAIKVISHNKEGKVPLYVYYLYKGLSNNNVNMQEQLLKRSQNEGKKIEEIIKELDDESYCNVFASGLNVIGSYDCTNGNSFIKDLSSGVGENKEINCSREYKMVIDMDLNVIESIIPENNPSLSKCEEFKSSICRYKPEIKVNTLLIDNTKDYQAYECDNIVLEKNNITESNSGYVLPKFNNPFKSPIKLINNIELGILSLDEVSTKYNFKVKIDKMGISAYCGIFYFENIEKTNPESEFNYGFKKIEFSNPGYDALILYKNYDDYVNFITGFGLISNANNGVNVYLGDSNSPYYARAIYSFLGATDININIINKYGQNALNDAKNCKTLDCDTPYYKRNFSYLIDNNYYEKYLLEIDNYGYSVWMTRLIIPFSQAIFPLYNHTSNILSLCNRFANLCNGSHNGYPYEFNDYKSNSNKGTYNEGSIEKTQTAERLIYAAIDTTFEKGEMDKNIFIFEHFEDKIIPVGYLANNENTPLKFDVITRDPVTFKIKKVNDKPLTYCEAMEYTGEKFSKYCECKDKNEKVITQYEEIKDSSCENTFGCMIRPVKPSISKKY